MKDRKARKRVGVYQFRGISKEQVCVIVGRERNKDKISKVACKGRIEKTQVEKVVGSLISEDTILYTDGWRSNKT